jgi:hypothetical protein
VTNLNGNKIPPKTPAQIAAEKKLAEQKKAAAEAKAKAEKAAKDAKLAADKRKQAEEKKKQVEQAAKQKPKPVNQKVVEAQKRAEQLKAQLEAQKKQQAIAAEKARKAKAEREETQRKLNAAKEKAKKEKEQAAKAAAAKNAALSAAKAAADKAAAAKAAAAKAAADKAAAARLVEEKRKQLAKAQEAKAKALKAAQAKTAKEKAEAEAAAKKEAQAKAQTVAAQTTANDGKVGMAAKPLNSGGYWAVTGNNGLLRDGKGVFQIGDQYFYSNGQGAYCQYMSKSDLGKCGAGNLKVTVIKGFDSTIRSNGGPCECVNGVYQVGKDLIWSNGKGAFCRYNGPLDLQRCTGQASPKITQISGFPKSLVLRDDGMCECTKKYPKGFFKVGNDFYYSNGDNAYCKYKGGQVGLKKCKVEGAKFSEAHVVPKGMRGDSDCTCSQ